MEKVAVTGFVAWFDAPDERRVVLRSSGAFGSSEEPQIVPRTGHTFFDLARDATTFGDGLWSALDAAPERIGVVFGSSKGDLSGLRAWAEQGIFAWSADALACQIARHFGVCGPVLSPNAACATGAHALALGAQWIQDDRADVVLAGAIEFPQHPLVLAAYKNMGALSKSGIMRPFDARRDGFVANAGGGFLVLQSETHARKQKIPIHGFLSGFSLKCDATHMTAMCPSGDSIQSAIEDALRKAGSPEIGYINAHGTATRLNDLVETRAIQSVFGREIPVSSTKGMTGHLLGAAGAVEAILCLMALRDQILPPTLGLETPDENFDLDFVLEARKADFGAALSLNYGFGGHIGALVFEKMEVSA